MSAISLQCFFCGAKFGLTLQYFCEKCGGTLDVNYDLDNAALDIERKNERNGIWSYRNFLPINPNVSPVSLGEGNTPLLHAEKLGKRLEIDSLFLKNETVNPTLSFKDRPLSVGVTKAKELNVRQIVTASTGNTGVSVSAYAAKAGIPCRVYVPARTPTPKTRMIRLFNAEVCEVQGDFSAAYECARKVAEQEGFFNATTTYLNPYIGEGNKTIAYELMEELGCVPDWILVPVGAGPLLGYCFKGFQELLAIGKADRLPKMVAVQATGCSPVTKAFVDKQDEVVPWKNTRTICGAIADPLTTYPKDGLRTLHVVRKSKGCSVAVDDEESLDYVNHLGALEGL